MYAQSWHFVRKIHKNFEYYKIIRVFCLLRGSKFQKVKELNRMFYLILKENGLIYENQFKYWTKYSYFWRYCTPILGILCLNSRRKIY
jgi:hypothetical protein